MLTKASGLSQVARGPRQTFYIETAPGRTAQISRAQFFQDGKGAYELLLEDDSLPLHCRARAGFGR